MITLGQIGLGYWGPNLLRSFDSLPASRVKVICDQDEGVLTRLAGRYPHVLLTTEAENLISDPEIDAVVVTSSSATHYPLANAALEGGKHVFVEKPIALRIEHAEALVHLAEARNLVLMVGHLLLYHPAVAYLKELISSGELGDVYYLYTARRNLGKIRQDENSHCRRLWHWRFECSRLTGAQSQEKDRSDQAASRQSESIQHHCYTSVQGRPSQMCRESGGRGNRTYLNSYLM